MVLSAGVIHSPAILLRSGVGPADQLRALGVSMVVDLPVGRGMQDHPTTIISLPLAAGARITSPDDRHTNVCVRWTSSTDGPFNDLMFGSLNQNVLAMALADTGASSGAYGVWLNKPCSRGELVLTSTDPLVQPRVEQRMLSDERDLPRMRAGVRALVDLARRDETRLILDAPLETQNAALLTALDQRPSARRAPARHRRRRTARDQHLPHGRPCRRRHRRRPRLPCPRRAGTARRRRLDLPLRHPRQHQRRHDHDRRAHGRPSRRMTCAAGSPDPTDQRELPTMNPPATGRPADITPQSAATPPEPGARPCRPGSPEIGVAAVAFGVMYLVTVQVLHHIPEDRAVAKGLAGYALSALIGLVAFAAAFTLRIRTLAVFGIRRASWKWLLAGAGFGVVAFILSTVATGVYRVLSGDTRNVQASYQAAATGSALSLVATLLLGAVATPVGEELAFRGVLTNALGRYGPWVAVLGSAAVFALAHGINPILPVAFVNGVVAALLFRKTGSVWPGVMVHLVNNALATLTTVLLPLLVAAN